MRDNPYLKIIDRHLGIPLCYLVGLSQVRRASDLAPIPEDLSKILLIKLSAVGDSVLAVPAWRSLRNHFPFAEFTLLCSSVTFDTVRTFPFFDTILGSDLQGYMKRPARFLRFVSDLRRRSFDLVIDFDQWMRITALLTFATGARHRIGFDPRDQHRGFCYTRTTRPPRNRHEVDNFLDLVELAGAPRGDRRLELWIPATDALLAAELLGRDQKLERSAESPEILVAMHPGCGGSGKPRQWPAELYAELANRLTHRYSHLRIMLTGSPGEKSLVDRIAAKLDKPCLNLAGPFSFTQFAALLQRCDLLVCGNTGAMHIAAAAGTPTVALHGPTNPNKWGPVGNRHTVVQSPIVCSPCLELGFDYGCTTHPCMRMISVSRVFDAVVSALEFAR